MYAYVIDRDTELCGHLKRVLWAKAQGANDTDLLDKVQKPSLKTSIHPRSVEVAGPRRS